MCVTAVSVSGVVESLITGKHTLKMERAPRGLLYGSPKLHRGQGTAGNCSTSAMAARPSKHAQRCHTHTVSSTHTGARTHTYTHTHWMKQLFIQEASPSCREAKRQRGREAERCSTRPLLEVAGPIYTISK